jgi:hypothetical protein
VKRAGDRDAGRFQVVDGPGDFRVGHVAGRVVVLVNPEDAAVLRRRVGLVQSLEIVGIFGQESEPVSGGVGGVDAVRSPRQARLSRCYDLMTRRDQTPGQFRAIRAVIEINP